MLEAIWLVIGDLRTAIHCLAGGMVRVSTVSEEEASPDPEPIAPPPESPALANARAMLAQWQRHVDSPGATTYAREQRRFWLAQVKALESETEPPAPPKAKPAKRKRKRPVRR